MTTIKDVAQLANVSIATVSHVLNGTRFVSKEVQLRIMNAMETLNYQPSAVARGLRTKKTNTMAIIIPDITNPFFADFTRGFQDVVDQKGFLVLVCNSDRILTREIRFLEMIWQQRVDGVVLNPAMVKVEDLSRLVKARISVVLIGSQIDNPDFNVVMIDNVKGGFDATQHLIDLGHRKIGLVCGLLNTTSGGLRYQGYLKALEENGIPFQDDLTAEGPITYEGGYQCTRQLLSKNELPTAVFATSDVMALGAKTAIEDVGLQIPGDISLIGFDDIPEVSRTRPRLSTIAQPKYGMGQEAAIILLEQIENKQTNTRKRVVMTHKVIARESTAALK
ncbi:MAG: LacI family DNA-binding transcriptional regulator [Anaerolineales bacterium]|nr:LacI family DNA-binding transcriptional regulator [Anaerolineales bacterium]